MRAFSAAAGARGIDTYACGQVDLNQRERSVFYAIGWPDAWRKFYLQSELMNRDPVIEALRRKTAPFTWADLRADRRMSPLGSEALRLIAGEGWTEGLAVPINVGPPWRRGLVSLVGRRGPLHEWEKFDLIALSLCFYQKARFLACLHGFPVPPAGLTQREIESLRLIAGGATDEKIGQAMRVSRATAHEFVEKARKKLGAATRAQAIAAAVALGIVSA